uniref:glycogen/starch/alpha-glucan phosphorylase n=1 Tax=Geoalkalibacter sp. TaxID=3041440 RepID=UPI00272E546C
MAKAAKNSGDNHEIAVTRPTSSDLQRAILKHLHHSQVKPTHFATPNDWYMATAFAVRDQMLNHWLRAFYELTSAKEKLKVVSYLSSEFLVGPHLENNLVNLDLRGAIGKALAALGQDLGEILRQEIEPGLGNGGLGRLAACYLESMATLRIPAVGYGIRYEFGIFE